MYDVYKRPSGLLYRVPIHSSLYANAEFYADKVGWLKSTHTVGRVITSKVSTLVARNVVFKDKACSQ
ncbi:hypothetical protein Kp_Pokalde_001_006 [Klebsiella phage Kp_Pokalde_001]|uniref:Uncharacterized protein n=1 Tax=Klebsiella phage Kp_Pokalde_001 TaxID=2849099 RepID=A0A8F2F483_9CAUD|nr:hypothetical protein Kp_Pokalde_001_006 [Klebsiella phage Kp_Pokalde_001]